MKRFLIFAFVLVLIFSLSGCGERNVDAENTTASTTAPTVLQNDSQIEGDYTMTEPQHTVGAEQTSQKFETGDGKYEILYFDENGYGAKREFYENGKLLYYTLSSGVDESGNCIQEKYYTAKGKFVATLDNGFFFDEDGNKLSEDDVLKELGE